MVRRGLRKPAAHHDLVGQSNVIATLSRPRVNALSRIELGSREAPGAADILVHPAQSAVREAQDCAIDIPGHNVMQLERPSTEFQRSSKRVQH
jgi:hypothetical protein